MNTTTIIALLRAINVGGTGKLPMAKLKAIAEEIGFENARTYIASGNLLFDTNLDEEAVRAKLAGSLEQYAGKPVDLVIRTAAEMARVAADNPFADEARNRVVAIFLDASPPRSALSDHRHKTEERIALGKREIYVHYPGGMGASRLIIPAAKAATARNMNTVARLAELASRTPAA